MTNDEKNIKAVVEAGEIVKYTKEDFKRWGAAGGKKRWSKTSKKDIDKHIAMMNQHRLDNIL